MRIQWAATHIAFCEMLSPITLKASQRQPFRRRLSIAAEDIFDWQFENLRNAESKRKRGIIAPFLDGVHRLARYAETIGQVLLGPIALCAQHFEAIVHCPTPLILRPMRHIGRGLMQLRQPGQRTIRLPTNMRRHVGPRQRLLGSPRWLLRLMRVPLRSVIGGLPTS